MSNDKWEQVKSPWVSWGKIGDHIIGTWISVREMPDQNEDGHKKRVYEIKADAGEYHTLDGNKQLVEPAVKINAGEIYNVGGNSYLPATGPQNPFDNQFRNIRLGQKIKVQFTESIPAKKAGYSATKVKTVFTNGTMDEEWLKEKAELEQANQMFENL